HQPDAGGGQRVADSDRAAVGVDARVVVGDVEGVQEGEHLDGECFVDLDQAEVLDVQSRQVERLAGGRHRAQAHQRRVHSGVGVGDQPGPGGQTELGGQVGGGEQGGGGPVGERGGGGGGDPAAGAEGRGQV